jgi:hypothetical protein
MSLLNLMLGWWWRRRWIRLLLLLDKFLHLDELSTIPAQVTRILLVILRVDVHM